MSNCNYSYSDLKDRSANKENQIINIENMGGQDMKPQMAHLRNANKAVITREPLRSRSLNKNRQQQNSSRKLKPHNHQQNEEQGLQNNHNNYNPYDNEYCNNENYRKSVDAMFRPSKILTFQNDQRTWEDYDDTQGESYYGLFPNSNFKSKFGSQQSNFGYHPNEMFLRQVNNNKANNCPQTNENNSRTAEKPPHYYLKDLIDIIFSSKFELIHFDKIREIIKLAAEDDFSYTIMLRNLDSISEIKVI